MKDLLKKLLMFSLVVTLILALGACGGDVEDDGPEEDTSSTADGDAGSDYPDWFLNPPSAEDALYAIGVARKDNPQLALDTATARARNEIARIVRVKVSTMTKDFMEEAGVSGESKSTEFTQVVSKQIADNTLSGSTRDKVHVDKTTDPDTFYVLVKLNLADMSGSIEQIMRDNAAAYARLQAKKGFDELEKELKKLNSSGYTDEPIIVEED